MILHDKIAELIDEELNERTNVLLNEYAVKISKKHAIPLDLLLRDIPETVGVTLCKGTKSNGERCMFKGTCDGYCRHHVTQGQKIKHRTLSSSNIHTHGPERMYVKGCPGCENSKELIDLGSIISNE